MTELSKAARDGAIDLLRFSDDYLAAQRVAAVPLESADIAAILSDAKRLCEAEHLELPDADVLLERCIVALLGGHIILQGPPGTAKTTLAYILAEAFNTTVHLETATADWSTYDVIGGLHPSATIAGGETLVPWLGHVPQAALECAGVIARHADEDEDEPHQAHWLIIDEFSRAEIDKAIGPLYTVLGGGGADSPLPLWFGATDQTKAVYLPKRFRIIGTMNTVDTNYVYSFSQGLTRRFQFIYVGVPEKSQIEAELQHARLTASEWYRDNYDREANAQSLVDDARVSEITGILAEFLGAVRYDDPDKNLLGWPIGTAQMVDVYRQIALRLPLASSSEDLLRALDLALADRVIPQASNLSREQLDRAEIWIESQPNLPRSLTALHHVRSAAATGY